MTRPKHIWISVKHNQSISVLTWTNLDTLSSLRDFFDLQGLLRRCYTIRFSRDYKEQVPIKYLSSLYTLIVQVTFSFICLAFRLHVKFKLWICLMNTRANDALKAERACIKRTWLTIIQNVQGFKFKSISRYSICRLISMPLPHRGHLLMSSCPCRV